MPPLPTVLNELLGILNRQDVTAGQVAALIERDTVLSGSVLRCVNSAYYGLPSQVSSIRHAVTLLGFGSVRNLAMVFSMRRMVSKKQPPAALYAAYSQHALAVAIMTQFLAHYTQSAETEAAFAAGLFHDIGHLLIMTTVPDAIPQVDSGLESAGYDIEVCEQNVLGITHAELATTILTEWKLPVSILEAARQHHQPDETGLPNGTGGVSLARLVLAADVYAKSQGLTIFPSMLIDDSASEAAFEKIGLKERWTDLTARFQGQFESIRDSIR